MVLRLVFIVTHFASFFNSYFKVGRCVYRHALMRSQTFLAIPPIYALHNFLDKVIEKPYNYIKCPIIRR